MDSLQVGHEGITTSCCDNCSNRIRKCVFAELLPMDERTGNLQTHRLIYICIIKHEQKVPIKKQDIQTQKHATRRFGEISHYVQ